MLNSNNHKEEAQENIVDRLEKLNQWQEQQKRLLEERQNMQRKMLGLEQKNMYQMLGLFYPDETASTATQQIVNPSVEDALRSNCGAADDAEDDYESDDKAAGFVENNNNPEPDIRDSDLNCGENLEMSNMKLQSKKRFLRRGEGLKQRFKIDPDTLRLDNLPRYKYASTHAKLNQLKEKKSDASIKSRTLKKVSSSEAIKPSTSSHAARATAIQSLDAQEKRFQQLLMSSKNTYHSTPDTKPAFNPNSGTLPKTQFNELPLSAQQQSRLSVAENLANSCDSDGSHALVTWSKVLDSQQIKPIPVHAIRGGRRSAMHIDEDSLSIFELIERKANQGIVDLNSSSFTNILRRKMRQHEEDNEDEDDDIPVDPRLKEMGLEPIVSDVEELEQPMDDEEITEDGENKYRDDDVGDDVEDEAVEYVEDRPSSVSSTVQEHYSNKPQMHVRFADETSTHEYEETVTTADSTLVPGDTSVFQSNDVFNALKNALFAALKDAEKRANTEAEGEMDGTTCSSPNQSSFHQLVPSSPTFSPAQSKELKHKTDLIKERLAELEREIAVFKENNMYLMKAKQEHELEKASFKQQTMDALDRFNDEKIKHEIYLHDERMKIEEDKRKFELHIKSQTLAVNAKQKKEILQLKHEVDALQLQLKQKDQTHASAQARLRTQIKQMEKDKKQLYDDIERLGKENKKLQMENSYLNREHNSNRMLQEINRNIAKLAPKLSSTNETATTTTKLNNSCVSIKSKAPKKPTPITVKAPSSSSGKKSARTYSKTSWQSRCSLSSSSLSEPDDTKKACGNPTTRVESDIGHDDDDDDENVTEICKELQHHANDLLVSTKVTQQKETVHSCNEEFKRELINSDGSKDIWYPNGNLKKISADGMIIRMLYFNKDIKETNINEGTVKYYYAETNTWHTTYLDGLEILEFPNGQTEHRLKNGIVEVHFPDNSIKVINPAEENKAEEWRFANGTNLIVMRNGDKIMTLSNGQKEIHTQLNKRREYPDGTVKIVYPDGSHETRYSNGRVRLKDKNGKLLMDSQNI